MKVLHVFATGGEAYGIERTLFSILPALAAEGVDVRVAVVAETRAGGLGERTAAGLRDCRCEYDVIEAKGRLPLGPARRLRQLVREHSPDVVHSHGYKCDLASLLSRAGRPRVSTVHGFCSRTSRERFYEWINVRCLKRMDAVIALCEDYRRRLLCRGVPDDRIRVAHVGVDPDRIPGSGRNFRREWSIGGDEVLVVQVGRLSPEKNPALFIEVAQRLCSIRRGGACVAPARFVLVGDGQLMSQLRAATSDAGVLLAGYVEEVGDVFRAADIAVNCSTTEGLPGALLEAGAMGVPVVATDVGGVAEIVEDGVTGILCPSGDAEAIAAAIGRLVEDGAFRKRAGAAARERIRTTFSVAACARRLLDVYEAAIGRKKESVP